MDIALDSPDLDLQKTLLEFAWRGRKYFYAPGVYLTGIYRRGLLLLRKLVSTLAR
jgi:hypothetical protein